MPIVRTIPKLVFSFDNGKKIVEIDGLLKLEHVRGADMLRIVSAPDLGAPWVTQYEPLDGLSDLRISVHYDGEVK